METAFQLVNDWDGKHIPKNPVVQVKEDGELVASERGKLYNRSGNIVTDRYPEVADALAGIDATLIMELCVFDWTPFPPSFLLQSGRVSRFEGGIQGRMNLANRAKIRLARIAQPVTAFVFDITEQDGRPTVDFPLSERQKLLEGILRPVAQKQPRAVVIAENYPFSELDRLRVEGDTLGLEGLVVKDLDAPSKPGHSFAWQKIKNWKEIVLPILPRSDGLLYEATTGSRGNDGFVVYVKLPNGEEQRVVVNDRAMQAKVKAATGEVRTILAYLQVTKDGSLRQPSVKALV